MGFRGKIDPEKMGQIHWNNNLAYLQQIDTLMQKKQEASIMGERYVWFRCNQQLLSLIGPVLMEGEAGTRLKELKQILSGVQMQLKSPKNTGVSWSQQALSDRNKISDIDEKLVEFDSQFAQCLFDYQIVKLKPKRRTVEEELEYDNTRED